MNVTMELQLPGRPEAVRVARHALEGLRGHLEDSVLETVRLLLSEVVTNSVRHGVGPKASAPEIDVLLRAQDDKVRVDVRDPGDGFEPAVREPVVGQSSGWGLFLVDRLSSRWGVSCEDRTQVWFEIERRPGDHAYAL